MAGRAAQSVSSVVPQRGFRAHTSLPKRCDRLLFSWQPAQSTHARGEENSKKWQARAERACKHALAHATALLTFRVPSRPPALAWQHSLARRSGSKWFIDLTLLRLQHVLIDGLMGKTHGMFRANHHTFPSIIIFSLSATVFLGVRLTTGSRTRRQ